MADQFLIGIPMYWRPYITEYRKKLSILTGERVGVREVVLMALAKFMGMPELYEDLMVGKVHEREERKAKAVRDMHRSPSEMTDMENDVVMQQLLARATSYLDKYEEKGGKIINTTIPKKYIKRGQRKAAKLEAKRQKAMKDNPETFMSDVPK